jgi:eukaryotic-like serine/threonine-protein kinase
MIARDPATRPADAFSARRALRALPWPSAIQPAAPRTRDHAPSDRPQAGRADYGPGAAGFDRWIQRRFEHAPLDEESKARASAFARAGHAALQGILRIDRAAERIWLEPASGHPLAGALTAPQIGELRAALDALHAAGVPHGRIDRDHVLIDDRGSAVLRFTPTCDPTATIDRDRLALSRLGAA